MPSFQGASGGFCGRGRGAAPCPCLLDPSRVSQGSQGSDRGWALQRSSYLLIINEAILIETLDPIISSASVPHRPSPSTDDTYRFDPETFLAGVP